MFQAIHKLPQKAILTLLIVSLFCQGLSVFANPVKGNGNLLKKGKFRHRKMAMDLDDQITRSKGKLGERKTQRVILQVDSLAAQITLKNAIESKGGRIKKSHNRFGLISVEIPLNRLKELEADDSFVYISPDREVVSTGHLETTSASTQVRSVISNTTLDGSGITIAILDSGMDSAHRLLEKNGASRVLFSPILLVHALEECFSYLL